MLFFNVSRGQDSTIMLSLRGYDQLDRARQMCEKSTCRRDGWGRSAKQLCTGAECFYFNVQEIQR